MFAAAAVRNLSRPTRAFTVGGRSFATAAAEKPTKPYVLVNKYTKVICQGITGKQVTLASCFVLYSTIKNNLIIN